MPGHSVEYYTPTPAEIAKIVGVVSIPEEEWRQIVDKPNAHMHLIGHKVYHDSQALWLWRGDRTRMVIPWATFNEEVWARYPGAAVNYNFVRITDHGQTLVVGIQDGPILREFAFAAGWVIEHRPRLVPAPVEHIREALVGQLTRARPDAVARQGQPSDPADDYRRGVAEGRKLQEELTFAREQKLVAQIAELNAHLETSRMRINQLRHERRTWMQVRVHEITCPKCRRYFCAVKTAGDAVLHECPGCQAEGR